MHNRPLPHLFLVCLYVKFFRVLQVDCQLTMYGKSTQCRLQWNRERNIRRKFPELVSDHVFRYGDVLVVLAIMYLELQTDEVG
jgi:hypothetical protein